MTQPAPAGATDSTAIDAALADFTDTMAQDGYHLRWTLNGDSEVTVRIEAGPDACADCLVPQPVMEAMMTQALSSTAYRLDHVEMPSG